MDRNHGKMTMFAIAMATGFALDLVWLERFANHDGCIGGRSCLTIASPWLEYQIWVEEGRTKPILQVLSAHDSRQFFTLCGLGLLFSTGLAGGLFRLQWTWRFVELRTIMVMTVLIALGWMTISDLRRRVDAWEASQVRIDAMCCLNH